MMKLDVDFVRQVYSHLKVVPSIVERENSVTVGNHMLYSADVDSRSGKIVYYVEQNGNEDEVYSSDNYRLAVLAMMQSHVRELVEGKEEFVAVEALAEMHWEDERQLKLAFDEGFAFGLEELSWELFPVPNPYPYGIEHNKRWTKGWIQGRLERTWRE